MSREPLAPSPGLWLYAYTQNEPVTGRDPSGLLPNRQVTAEGAGFCGSGGHELVWTGFKKGDNGLIVQHVISRCEKEACVRPGNSKCVQPNMEYWEVWGVIDGEVVGLTASMQPRYARRGYSIGDVFELPFEGVCSKGHKSMKGLSQFLRNKWVGYLAGWIFGASYAPSQWSTPKKPSGWSDAGATVHSVALKWNCCPDKNLSKGTFVPPRAK
jgi:hypothetical protein